MTSEKRWTLSSLIELGVLVAGSIIAAILLSSAATILAKSRLTGHQMDLVRVIISITCIQGVSFLWIHLFLKRNETTWGEAFGFSQRNYGRCLAAALIALVIIFLGMTVLQGISTWVLNKLYMRLHWDWLKPELQQIVQILQKEWPWSLILVQGIAALVIAPISEELIFRGILYPFAKQRGRPLLALWATSVLFALIHLNPAGFLSFIFLAMMLVAVYERTKNLLAPILLHSLFNTVSFVIIVAHPKWAEPLFQQ